MVMVMVMVMMNLLLDNRNMKFVSGLRIILQAKSSKSIDCVPLNLGSWMAQVLINRLLQSISTMAMVMAKTMTTYSQKQILPNNGLRLKRQFGNGNAFNETT